jgi:hypothetical protein
MAAVEQVALVEQLVVVLEVLVEVAMVAPLTQQVVMGQQIPEEVEVEHQQTLLQPELMVVMVAQVLLLSGIGFKICH